MQKNNTLIIFYLIGHFLVDFSCAYLLYQLVYGTSHWYPYLLYYNFCAFALQMPLGLIADRWNHNALCAAAGCGLTALAYGLGFSEITTAVILAGIGNALFHIGGGIDILNFSRDKSFLPGIYVSPGALGIYLGMKLGKQNMISDWLIIFFLLVTAVLILTTFYKENRTLQSGNSPVSFAGITSSGVLAAISCLFTVVCLRSYIGIIANFSWKSKGIWGTALICAVVLGKMSGGLLADKLGPIKASVISLVLASILYLFSNTPLPGILAVFFFNMTMPVTLWALAHILTGSKGFAFGLLTFGLFLGFVPVYLGFPPLVTASAGFSIAALFSLALLWSGLYKAVV